IRFAARQADELLNAAVARRKPLAWLQRHHGKPLHLLFWIVDDLRAPKVTKAARLELADALERVGVLINCELPWPKSHGAPMKPDTWRKYGLARALMDRGATSNRTKAARAACGVDADEKLVDRVRK